MLNELMKKFSLRAGVFSSFCRFVFLFGLASFCSRCATTSSIEPNNRAVLQVQVEQGDTLNKIARQFDVAWQEIATKNKDTLRSGLRVGQVLNIVPGPNADLPQLHVAQENSSLSQDEQPDDEDDIQFVPKKRGLLFGGTVDESKPLDFIFPVEGRISSKFGKRGRKFHKGIDIAVNTGTPLVAIAAGEVIFSGKRRGYGGTVVIDHGTHMSLYAHCSKMIAKKGDKVKQGDYIARSGRTGNARGAHLHFEIRDSKNRPIDPLPLLRRKTLSFIDLQSPLNLIASAE
ncbi:MAG: M23 family metallopeptidase [Proteobacteria bacterium]|nr:M23 family metallopeptidase [Pseudomonadota bacterium]